MNDAMCTVVILRRPDHDWPLILGANRDEVLDRPWTPPGRNWADRANVRGGRDNLAGGTWLGVNDTGVVAAILNRRGSLGPQDGFRSRGELPLEALDHADAASAAEALNNINPEGYRPFNMVIADNRDAYWLKVTTAQWGANVELTPLPPGLSMVTASDRNDSNSARIRTYLPQFEKAKPPDPVSGDWSDWKNLFASRIHDHNEGPDGAMAIVTDKGFGTVSSSLVALPSVDRPSFDIEYLFAAGRPGVEPYTPVEQ